jgi:hypothetical protein
MFGCFIWLALVVLMAAALWRLFEKAEQPGWAALVPIYNLVVLCQIAGRPGWWAVLFFIPVVNVVIGAIMAYGIACNFGHGLGMTLLLVFLPFIGYPLLGFGDSDYAPTV